MSSTALRKTLRVALWSLVFAVLAVLFAKAFYGDVYYVDSPSMEPTIHGAEEGGEYVFVRYARRPQLERFDLVVFMRDGERVPLVKRVVALPGESVQISGGDLFVKIRGGDSFVSIARLLGDAARPPPIEMFDSRRDDLAAAFGFAAANWKHGDDMWRLDARGAREQFAQWRTRLTDDHRGPDGKLVAGKHQVGDAQLELEARIEGDWQRFSMRLSEQSDVFELELTPRDANTAHVRLSRTHFKGGAAPFEPIGVLAEADVALAGGTWHRLTFGNIDNELRFDVDGERGVVRATYATNTPMSGAPDSAMVHVPPRIAFGGDDLVAQFRRVRVWRDINYTSGPGRHGTELPQTLGPNEVFVLGDNSSESKDSREWGPVELDSVIGKPRWVVWPPSRRRPLQPTEATSE